jgi:hypothetical protein
MRGMITRLTAAFLAASAVGGSVAAPIAIYVFEAYDPKFRDAPFIALQLSLLNVALLAVIGALIFCAACLLLRKRITAHPKATRLALAAGVVYQLIPYLLHPVLDPDAAISLVIAITYVIGLPLLAAMALRRPNTDAHAL